MKSSELMIGDLVYYGNKPVNVLQLSEGKDYQQIRPIPLDDEILSKNGFIKGKYGCYTHKLKEGDDVLYIAIYREGNGMTEIEYDKICQNVDDPDETLFGSTLEIPHPICVHELQHILHIVGFQKKIKP